MFSLSMSGAKRFMFCLFISMVSVTTLEAQPTAIGDFFWYDTNNDGIQDPGEPQLNGVVVQLWTQDAFGNFVQVGITTTAADGTYCFNDANSVFPLIPGQTYWISTPNVINEPGTANPTAPTLLDTGGGLLQDFLDNDASLSTVAGAPFNGLPAIEFVPTAGTGEDKTLDFGFYTLCDNLEVDILPTGNIQACEGETVTLVAQTEGTNPIAGYDWSNGASTVTNTLDVVVSTSGFFSVTVTDDIGCTNTSQIFVEVERCPGDLSLVKTTRQDTAYVPGDLILFEIVVCNEGLSPYDRFEIFDYLPVGYIPAASPNPGDPTWMVFASNAVQNSLSLEISRTNGLIPAEGFLPGDCMTLPLYATLDPCATTDNLTNCAVINEQTDLYGFIDDADSNPGPDVDAEDDSDCIAAPVFDLALAKKTTDTAPFLCGDEVTFEICVTNQGSVPASDVTIIDYLPAGMEFLAGQNSNWTFNSGNSTALYTIPGLIQPGETKTFPLNIGLTPGNGGGSDWTNIAEIFAAEDTFGIDRSLFDIDSPYDDDPTNDVGGTPGSDEDDHIDDNRYDKDGDEIFDEDDHDPEMIPYFDLALRKEVITPPPYTYQSDVTFEITICNQGNVTANNIAVNDYIPAGFSFDPGSNSGIWGGGNPLTSVTIGQLLPEECVPIQITLDIMKTDGGLKDWTNYAEIVSATDAMGVSMTDADSDLGSNTPEENEVCQGDPDDDNMLGGGAAKGEDEDDHDPAGIAVNDLALRKTILTAGPYSLGQTVKYQIEVCNQGNTHVSTVGIVDYIPDGLEYKISNFPTWFTDPSGELAAHSMKDVAPGDCKFVTIDLEITKSLAGAGAWDNEAEIYYMEDAEWNNLDDIDSNPDTDPLNDFGGEPWTADDDNIDGCGPTVMEDEDDHDPARIELFDLALTKELVTPAPYFYGKVVEFKITVFNQGSEDATLVNVADYIPTGYAYVPGNNTAWTGAAPTVNHEFPGTILAGESAEVSIFLEIIKDPCGTKSWTNYAEIISAANGAGEDRTNLDIDSTPGSNASHETDVDYGDEDDNNIAGCGLLAGEDEDDHDPAGLDVTDLALSKTTVESGPFAIGDLVTFQINVTNQGNVPVAKTGIVDYIPVGFSNVIGNSPTWSFDPTAGVATTSLKDLLPCETRTIDLVLKVEKSDVGGYELWCNNAEIYYMEDSDWVDLLDFDSAPDLILGNDLFTNDEIDDCDIDEDDHDEECIEIFDLALVKEVVTPGPYFYGQNVQFRIRVYNQGNTDATLVNIADYIPSGFAFDSAVNAGWTGAAPTVNFEIPVTIAPGTFFDASIFLEVVQSCGEDSWTNYAEIVSAANGLGEDRTANDVDSTPASNAGHERAVTCGADYDNVYTGCGLSANEDEDDHDPACIEINDLALRKTTTDVGPFVPGDIVTYQIEVINQGNTTIHSVGVIDYIPTGLTNVLGNAPLWNYDAAANLSTATISNIAPCEIRTLEIQLLVEKSNVGGATFWCNNAEIYYMQDSNWNDVDDIDSTPDFVNGNDITMDNEVDDNDIDQDDFDVECIEVFDLALTKEVITPGPYFYGQMVQFGIRIYNQGNEPATLVNITDYIPAGYAFDAGSNPAWSGSAPMVTYEVPVPIAPGGFFDASIFLEVVQGCGEKNWTNYAEIISAANAAGVDRTNNDTDSTPGSNAGHETAVDYGDPFDNVIDGCGPGEGEDEDDHDPAGIDVNDLALRKTTTDVGPFAIGDIVTYQIEVINQGNTTIHSVGVIDYIPTGFTNVLGNAPLWNYDPASNVSTTTLSNIAPCETRTLEIQLLLEKSSTGGSEFWCNEAEIYFMQDSDWNDVDDIDSTPDFVNGNDVFTDNEVIDNTIDQDDHDEECVEIVDLALVKTVVTSAPYFYGQNVQFNIRVYNQGNGDATLVNIADYVPAGYGFAPSFNPGWTGAPPLLNYEVPIAIAPGGFFDVTLFLTLQKSDGCNKDWINYAEIVSHANAAGEDRTGWDIDSTPGSNSTYENEVDEYHIFNDVFDGCGEAEGEDEDDHDPAGVEVIDVALRKTTDEIGPFKLGDIVTYKIDVINQGAVTVAQIGIADYIPNGLEYVATNGPVWTSGALGDIATTTVTNLEVCETRTVEIDLRVTKSLLADNTTAWDNHAEVYFMSDASFVPVLDIDSYPDDIFGNDSGGVVETADDDNVDGCGPNAPPGEDDDEDDHDPERIPIFDLALTKEVVTPGPYEYCQVVEFEITVYNQGNEPATLVHVADYIAPGYYFDPALNPGWTGPGTSQLYEIPGTIMPGTSVSIPIFLELIPGCGADDWVNYAEIFLAADSNSLIACDIDSSPGSNTGFETSVKPGDPDDNNISGCGPLALEDEDDHDPAGITVYDVALLKTVDTFGPYDWGDTVTYSITVCNQGSFPVRNIDIIDYIPVGLEFVSGNFPTWDYNEFDEEAVTRVMGPLAPCDCETVKIDLEVLKLKNDEDAWDNRAEIFGFKDENFIVVDDIDSTPDAIVGNDVGGTPWTPEDDHIDDDGTDCNDDGILDEDDEDVARIEIVDLALRKVLETPPVHFYGQVVDFSVWLFNQGNEEANNIVVTDYLPPGYAFDPAINPGWSVIGAGPNLEYTHTGPLPAVDSVQIPLKLEIICTNGGRKHWTNYAEITSHQGRASVGYPFRMTWEMDSTPGSDSSWERNVCLPPYNTPTQEAFPWDDEICGCGPLYNEDEDDHDPAGIEIFDLALRKTTLDTPPFRYCENMTYDMTVFNQGSLSAFDVEVTDYIPCGFEFDQADNPDWTYDPVFRKAKRTIPGELEPGDNTQVSLVLKIVPCIDESLIAWTNCAEVSDADTEPLYIADDFDSHLDEVNNETTWVDNAIKDPNDEDDHDCEKIDILDLALRKTTPDCGPFAIGDTVEFEVTIFNQGNVPTGNIFVIDSINTGFIWLPALNPDWVGFGSYASWVINTPLAPMDSIKTSIFFEITIDDDPYNTDWWNRAEIGFANDSSFGITIDADSNPDAIFTNDNYVEPSSPTLGFIDPNDDVIDESWPTCEPGDDEDDSDPAKVLVVGGLGDYVWKDLDGDGIQEVGEPGIPNVVVYLLDCDGNVVDVQVTDDDGFYFFDNIIQGFYQLQFDISDQPAGCAFTLQDQGNDDTIDSDVDLSGNIPCMEVLAGVYDSTFDAGVLILAEKGDFVWEDMDGDGIQDPDEPGLENVIVHLYAADGTLVKSTFTDANGYYLFDLIYPGDYYVEFEIPTDYFVTWPNSGSNDNVDSDIIDLENGRARIPLFTLNSGDVKLNCDAGFYRCVPIGELVWYDTNQNDVWDSEENGINGLWVFLYKFENGTWTKYDSTETGHKPGTPSDDGYFKFCAKPGSYYVEIKSPPYGLVPARPHVGSNENADSDLDNTFGMGTTTFFTVRSGDVKCDIGAGYYPQAQIGDRVWSDINANGMQENNEPPFAGIVIKAYNMSGDMVVQDTTDANGRFMITGLQKEDYYLRIMTPPNYGLTYANTVNDLIDSDFDHSNGYNTSPTYSMSPGDSITNVDAGLMFGVLPIELLSFEGTNRSSHNYLVWETTNEVNNSHFELERSFDNQDNFEMIAKHEAVAVSAEVNVYDQEDHDISENGIYYYRLKQVDLDGAFTYSHIVAIRVNKANVTNVNTYPNPAIDDVVIEFTIEKDAPVTMDIWDAAGQLVMTKAISENMESGNHERMINISHLTSGVYTMKFNIDGDIFEKQLIVVRR